MPRPTTLLRPARLATLLLSALAPAALAAPPATMQAVRIHAYGGPDQLKLESAPTPTPGPGEVLVKVHAAGVNPVDWKIREGAFNSPSTKFPITLGYDVCGTVEAVGDNVARIQIGDVVYSYINLARGGGYAEYVTIAENEVALKPTTLEPVEAAAVPLAALTAWQALFDNANLKRGQTVLIHGAAGGVGTFAVQFAKFKGATVIATASEKNHAYLKDLGADVVIDYNTQKFEEIAKDVDVVLDSIGGDTQDRSFAVLKKGGILVSIVGPVSPQKAAEHGVRGKSMLVQPSAAQLAEIGALIDQEKVKVVVSHIMPLADAAKAHEQSQTGHTRGKIVLKVAN
jgi:NADPH:quinone reductase-like Zn-dependent oxidoreductase